MILFALPLSLGLPARIEAGQCFQVALDKVPGLQRDAFRRQNLLRNLTDYQAFFGRSFTRFLKAGQKTKGFHWIDMGGGAGFAGLESLFYAPDEGSVFDLFDVKDLNPDHLDFLSRVMPHELQPTLDKAYRRVETRKRIGLHDVTVVTYEDAQSLLFSQDERALKKFSRINPDYGRRLKLDGILKDKVPAGDPQYRYLSGRLLEEIPDRELRSADLITDVYGVYSYSPDKVGTLLRYAKALKRNGKCYVMPGKAVVETEDGVVALGSLLSKIEGFRLDDGILILENPTKKTLRMLEDLRDRLEFVTTKGSGMPPAYHYRSRD